MAVTAYLAAAALTAYPAAPATTAEATHLPLTRRAVQFPFEHSTHARPSARDGRSRASALRGPSDVIQVVSWVGVRRAMVRRDANLVRPFISEAGRRAGPSVAHQRDPFGRLGQIVWIFDPHVSYPELRLCTTPSPGLCSSRRVSVVNWPGFGTQLRSAGVRTAPGSIPKLPK